MREIVQESEILAIESGRLRREKHTHSPNQLVVTMLMPMEAISAEACKCDQLVRVEEGTGESVLGGVRTAVVAGFAVRVPAGTNHYIVNTGSIPLRFYTLYAHWANRDGVCRRARTDEAADHESFNGNTLE